MSAMIWRSALVATLAVASACNRDGGQPADGGSRADAAPPPDRSDEMFARDMVQIEIDVEPAYWDQLRGEHRTRHQVFGQRNCRDSPIASPYSWVAARVTIDGEVLPGAGVRKKGFIGSQSTLRPSLKIDLDRFAPGQHYLGFERFALNNNRADSSRLRTCTTYEVFAKIGVPAPRCTLARVVVNGVDLGVYSAIDEVRKPFLDRHFGDASGALFEGTISDFQPDLVGGFEQDEPGIGDEAAILLAITDVLNTASDTELEVELEPLVNLDAFYRYWALESLLWLRDGYAGNTNNFYLYANPADGGRLHFLVWGADAGFHPNAVAAYPSSVLARGALANRLYATESGRTRYTQELAQLLDEHWDEAALRGEVESRAARVRPVLAEAERGAFDDSVTELADFISQRRDIIAAAQADGPPPWTGGLRELPCVAPTGEVTATFTTTWDTLAGPTVGSGTLDVMLDGSAVAVSNITSRTGAVENSLRATTMVRTRVAGVLPGQRSITFEVDVPIDDRYFETYAAVGEHPLILPPTSTRVHVRDTSATPATIIRRLDVGEGTWTFQTIEMTGGAEVVGSFRGTIYERP